MILTIASTVFWILILTASFAAKAKGTVWLLVYLLISAVMIWVGGLIPADWMSAIDSLMFLLLLLWIVTVNKHSIRRPK